MVTGPKIYDFLGLEERICEKLVQILTVLTDFNRLKLMINFGQKLFSVND